jgi:predicted amidophosphoribosyltransferase
MTKINPLRITGPWDAGFTLDAHTISAEFLGYDLDGRAQFDTVRSELGEMLYRLKYRGDRAASIPLAAVAAEFIRARRLPVDVIVPVPPSKVRSFQPLLAIASSLASELRVGFDARSLRKVKETAELKSVEEMAEREAALEGAFDVQGHALTGRRILMLDDLYRSGATMSEAARTLRSRGRIASLVVLALTRTRSRS